jgi:hypothetical protein
MYMKHANSTTSWVNSVSCMSAIFWGRYSACWCCSISEWWWMLYHHYVKICRLLFMALLDVLNDLILLRILFSWTLDSVSPLFIFVAFWRHGNASALSVHLAPIFVLLCSIISPFYLVNIRNKLTVVSFILRDRQGKLLGNSHCDGHSSLLTYKDWSKQSLVPHALFSSYRAFWMLNLMTLEWVCGYSVLMNFCAMLVYSHKFFSFLLTMYYVRKLS